MTKKGETFKLKVTDEQGLETSVDALPGDRISKFVPEGMVVYLEGEEQDYDAEVRPGDHLECQRKSGKAGE